MVQLRQASLNNQQERGCFVKGDDKEAQEGRWATETNKIKFNRKMK
jgi:hypothetical protein